MDTHSRLRQLMAERGWTAYRLAKVSGLSESTLANIFKRNTVPSIATLEAVCSAFGISLAQFFAADDPGNERKIKTSAGDDKVSSALLFFCI